MTPLTPDERADLWDLLIRYHHDILPASDVLAHVTELAAAYYDAGLVEGDLGRDGTIRAEAEAPGYPVRTYSTTLPVSDEFVAMQAADFPEATP